MKISVATNTLSARKDGKTFVFNRQSIAPKRASQTDVAKT